MGDPGPTSGTASDKLCELGSWLAHIKSDRDRLLLSVGLELRGVPDLLQSCGSSPQKDAITGISTHYSRRSTDAPKLGSVELTLKMNETVLAATNT